MTKGNGTFQNIGPRAQDIYLFGIGNGISRSFNFGRGYNKSYASVIIFWNKYASRGDLDV